MSQNSNYSTFVPADTGQFESPSRLRVRAGLFITLFGLFVFIVGAKPGWLGLDRSEVVGFVQIAVFLVGLALICFGGYITLLALWKGKQRTIAADIGLRLVSTGYVIAAFAGHSHYRRYRTSGHGRLLGFLLDRSLSLLDFSY
jgi:hypothetical protein